MLEEESFQERTKRLAAEGVPEPEIAMTVNAPYSYHEALADLHERKTHKIIEDIRPVEPLLYEARSTKLFAELLRRATDHEVVEMEFTYLVNAAVVRFGVDFADQEQVLNLCERIKGAINLGLEKLLKDSDRLIGDLYQSLGLEKIYRLGLTELLSLRALARKIPLEQAELIKDSEQVRFSIIACARENLPCMPVCVEDSGKVIENGGVLESGNRPIESMQAVSFLRRSLEELISSASGDQAK
jgi:hypothetical protein